MPLVLFNRGIDNLGVSSVVVDDYRGAFEATKHLISQGCNSPNRNRALKEKLSNDIYAGAPYLRQLTTGETILSYQSTEGRDKDWAKACMNVVLGDENGKNFAGKTIPFQVPVNKNGLWNSLCILADNTIIALTSANAFTEGATEVWMIKGHISTNRK